MDKKIAIAEHTKRATKVLTIQRAIKQEQVEIQ